LRGCGLAGMFCGPTRGEGPPPAKGGAPGAGAAHTEARKPAT